MLAAQRDAIAHGVGFRNHILGTGRDAGYLRETIDGRGCLEYNGVARRRLERHVVAFTGQHGEGQRERAWVRGYTRSLYGEPGDRRPLDLAEVDLQRIIAADQLCRYSPFAVHGLVLDDIAPDAAQGSRHGCAGAQIVAAISPGQDVFNGGALALGEELLGPLVHLHVFADPPGLFGVQIRHIDD